MAALLRALWLPALVGLAAVVAGLLDRLVRPRLLRLLFGLAVVVGIGLAQVLATGVETAERGELWVWLAVLLPAVLLLGGSRTARLSGIACLIVLAVVGILAWRRDIDAHQQTRAQYAAIVADAIRPRLDGSVPTVVVYQDPKLQGTVRGGTMSGIMRMMLRGELGVVPEWCAGTQCAPLEEAARAHRTASTGAGSSGPTESPEDAGRFVVEVGDVRGVIVPPLPPWWS